MRTSIAVAAAALAAGASASVQAKGNGTVPLYTTEVLTAFTTYCPSPTSIVHNNQTYTIRSATTFTITDCPCTVTKPITTKTITTCTACPNPVTIVTTPVTSAAPGLLTHVPAGPVLPPPSPPVIHVQPSVAPPVYINATSPGVPVRPTTTVPGGAKPTGAPATTTGPANPGFTGAANRAVVASGAGLAGIVAMAAYFL